MVVVSSTVLLQVLLLSAFGLASLKGQEAEVEQNTRDLCRRVLATNLVDEVVRRIETAEAGAAGALESLWVVKPESDAGLARAVQGLLGPESFFRRAFLIGVDGAWHDDRQRLIRPPDESRPSTLGGDAVQPFEEIEARVDAGLDLDAAIQEVRARLEKASSSAEPYGLRLLARLYRRAGRTREAIEKLGEICRRFPTSLDTLSIPAVPVGPEAGRSKAELRVAALERGTAAPAAMIADLVELRRLLLVNRFQMEEHRIEWERSRLRDIAEEAALHLEIADRSELSDRLEAVGEQEESFRLFRRLFGDSIQAVARGDAEGGRLTEVLPEGPRTILAVPIRDVAGLPTGAVVLELDLARIRSDVLPEVVRGLPLPDGVAASVVDAEGRPVAAGLPPATGAILAEDRLGDVLPYYRPVVFLQDADFAERQTASARQLHYGVMGLSIAGILAAGWFVVRTVRRELKVAKMQSDFLSNVTHELKTPLTSIRMFVETLKEGRVRDEGERKECLDVISREAGRLTGLIQRVLDLARLERKRDEGLKRTSTDLGRLVTESAEIFRLRMGESEARLAVEMRGDLPRVSLDPGAVQELILNLLSNALKYGGRNIRLSADVARGVARITVEDDGIGISEEDRKRVFEKFYRADDTLARDVEGSGLGLALVREIARAHRGRVRVKSEKEKGSCFVVTLPVR